MFHRAISIFCIAVFLAIKPSAIIGQSGDSLLILLNNGQLKEDTATYFLLYKMISIVGDLNKSSEYCNAAVQLAERMNRNPATAYISMGYRYLDAGNLATALKYFFEAANSYKKFRVNEGLASVYQCIAETYNKQDNHNNEKFYLKNAINIFEKERDTINFISATINLGYADYSMGLYDSALIIFSTTKELCNRIGYTIGYAYCIGNSGLVYSRLSDNEKAEDNLLKAIGLLAKERDERAITEYTIAYANTLTSKGELANAIKSATLAFNKAVKFGLKDYQRDAANTLAHLYRTTNRYDSAYHYQSIFIRANDSIQSDRNIREMADLRTEFEVAQKQSEVEILEKSKVLRGIVILGLGVILVLAIGLILVYYKSLKRSKKLTAELDERRALLEKQSEELREKNDSIIIANKELKQLYEISNSQKEEIISSINYAQRIQQAMLPPETYITELINENFIFFKPKEIVSGDFYWIKQINHNIVLVSADCTGHGVPGAFMSMLGIGYLNEIVQNKKEIHANQILNELRKEIKHSLRQTGKTEESREGIEMALCVIDTSTGTMQYSGAFSPLYLISNANGKPQLREIKADSMPVGVHFLIDKSFTNHEIKLEIGDTFYIFTDGFIDQVGGIKDNRFGSKNFQKLLLKICELPMFEQRNILEKTFNEWKGDQSQRDDILVIGARV